MSEQRMKIRFTLVAVVGALLAIVAGSSASAAAPRSFYGVSSQTPVTTTDLDRMGQGKVGTLRITLGWSGIDPSAAPDDYDWGGTDAIVADAARNGISVLPFLFGTPQWVARDLDGRSCTSNCVLFAPSSRRGARRLGRVPARRGRPLRAERRLLDREPGPAAAPDHRLADLERAELEELLPADGRAPRTTEAAQGIERGDQGRRPRRRRDPRRHGRAGRFEEGDPGPRSTSTSSTTARGRRSTSTGSPSHPYGAKVTAVQDQVELFRKAMKRARDGGADLWITEMGWGSARGGNPLNRGPQGQATRLKQAFKYFTKRRGKLNVRTVIWFSWMDSADQDLRLVRQVGPVRHAVRTEAVLARIHQVHRG